MKYSDGMFILASCAVAAAPLTAGAALTEWPGNGHFYESVAADGVDWPVARAAADSVVNEDNRGLRCYLATLTSAAEDAFVDGVRSGTPGVNTSGGFADSELWIGAEQIPPTAAATAGWTWVTGEPFSFTDWLAGEPNDAGGDERYLAIGWSNMAGWNDEAQLDGIFGYVRECEVDVEAAPDGPVDATSGVATVIDVLANDTVNAAVDTVEIETSPLSGEGTLVSVLEDFSIEYTSDSAFEGTDTFEYRVTDVNGAFSIAEVTVEVAAGQAIVAPGNNQLIFNQATNPAPNSVNPVTAAYKKVLSGGQVEISCCRVLDEREGAGRRGRFLPREFDLGLAVARTDLNPSCAEADMPAIAQGTAVLRPWQRGVPKSRGFLDPDSTVDAREHDLGVCVIEAEVDSRGVVFSAEQAANVLGYALDGAIERIRYRPFTGGVSTDPQEVDAPYVTPWTAEWDESRSGKRYSDNVMVVNLWHEWLLLPSVPYLYQLAASLRDSIDGFRTAPCGINSGGFLDDLEALVRSAQWDILRAIIPWRRAAAGQSAVDKLDDATRLALLIGPDAPAGDPYDACPDNPEGLFVGRSMSLKFAACSELVHPRSSASSLDGACMIEEDILCELPALPGFPHPSTCPPQ